MTASFALVTKTYRGDMQPFRDLCQSIDRLMPDTMHYVLVDAQDFAAFRDMNSPKRKIVNCAHLLPKLKAIQIGHRRIWWSGGFKLVRGWIYQQLAKIAFVAQMDEDAAVHLDSDVTLLQPITVDQIFRTGKVRLFRNAGGGQSANHIKWHEHAQSDLGLPVSGYAGFDYVGPGITWSSAVVQAMIGQIENTTSRPWFNTLAGHFRFSEYIHYGVFCDQVPGPHQALIAGSDDQFCHTCWGYDLDSTAGVDRFVADLRPDHRSVLIQSNLGLSEPMRRAILEQVQTRFEVLAGAPSA